MGAAASGEPITALLSGIMRRKMTSSMAEYVNRAIGKPRQSFFLFGPRGTGKTTWVRHEFPDAHVIDLLDEALYQSLLADVSRFAAELRSRPDGSWVFVDEIQRLPNLLNEVHRAIEERGLRFVLTGSSARKLRRSGVNLLAGRALRRTMYPFLPAELGAAFDLDVALRFGTIPLVWSSAEREETLRAYVQTYLREEVKGEALVRNLPGFARFLPVAALFHAQVLNVAGAARDAQIGRTALAGYLDILEDTLLAFRLPAFESRLRVRERRHPKLYWVDPGIVRAVSGRFGALDARERGPLFEGWVATVLKAYGEHKHLFESWYYWAPADTRATEVDFVLETQGGYVAIEAKAADGVHGHMLRGLRAVGELAGMRKRVAVYTGARQMRTEDGIDIWPVGTFVDALEAGELFR